MSAGVAEGVFSSLLSGSAAGVAEVPGWSLLSGLSVDRSLSALPTSLSPLVLALTFTLALPFSLFSGLAVGSGVFLATAFFFFLAYVSLTRLSASKTLS